MWLPGWLDWLGSQKRALRGLHAHAALQRGAHMLSRSAGRAGGEGPGGPRRRRRGKRRRWNAKTLATKGKRKEDGGEGTEPTGIAVLL